MMKRTVAFGAALFAFSTLAMASAQPEIVSASPQMDVAEVISITPSDLSSECGVTSQTMQFKDASGALKQVTFKLFGTGCSGG